jgi:thioredoxin reductase
MKTDSYDVIVVGGGAAGLSAALVLGRARRRVVVIDSGEPRNAPASHMHGYLSRDGLPPAELLQLGREESESYGVEFVSNRVASVEPGFSLVLANRATMNARRLILATGSAISPTRGTSTERHASRTTAFIFQPSFQLGARPAR